jgi:hypothetical protein
MGERGEFPPAHQSGAPAGSVVSHPGLAMPEVNDPVRTRQLQRYWKLKAQADGLHARYRVYSDQLMPLLEERTQLQHRLTVVIPEEMGFHPAVERESVTRRAATRLHEVQAELAFLHQGRQKVEDDWKRLSVLLDRLRACLKLSDGKTMSVRG